MCTLIAMTDDWSFRQLSSAEPVTLDTNLLQQLGITPAQAENFERAGPQQLERLLPLAQVIG